MTHIVTISQFARSLLRRAAGPARVQHTRVASDRIPVAEDHRLNSLVQAIEHQATQHRHHGGPTGVSPCVWRGTANTEANFVEATCLLLDYRAGVFEELRAASDGLGLARVWFTGEDFARSTNTVAMVIPFTQPATKAQYERIASCVVKELDVYGLIDGALTVSHLAYVHATTLAAYDRGALLDPQAFIERTARQYQARDARKYHATTRPVAPPPAPTTWIGDDVFAWPETPAERRVRDADELLASLGVTTRSSSGCGG